MKTILLLMKNEQKSFEYMNLFKGEYNIISCSSVKEALLSCSRTNVTLVIYEFAMEKTICISFFDLIWSVVNRPSVIAVGEKEDIKQNIAIISENAVDYVDFDEDEELFCLRIKKYALSSTSYLYGKVTENKKERITLEFDSSSCYKDGKLVHLSGLEFSILNIFISAVNYEFTREFLYTMVFGSILYSSDIRKVDEVIYKLRKKLKITSIEALTSFGYVWRE